MTKTKENNVSYYAKPWVAVGLSLGVLTIAGCHSSGDTETDSDTVIWKAITLPVNRSEFCIDYFAGKNRHERSAGER